MLRIRAHATSSLHDRSYTDRRPRIPIRTPSNTMETNSTQRVLKGCGRPFTLNLPPTMNRPPCHFQFSPGGCRKGNKCYFAHINTDSTISRNSTPGPSSAPGSSSLPQPSTSSPAPAPGVCSYYWKRGECKREFECRFKHIQSPGAREASPSQSPSANLFKNIAAKELVAPFLTEKGLAKINGNATDGFFSGNKTSSLSPTDVHSRLKRFFADNFKFSTRYDIYAFLVLLCCANSSNTLWVRCCLVLSLIRLLDTMLDSRRRTGMQVFRALLFLAYLFTF
jgi:hypothetical protein